jgi:hypothetical protein
MTDSSPDLSRLKINRDSPRPGLRRAFRNAVLLAAGALVLVVVAVVWLRGSGAGTPVQVVTATLSGGGGAEIGRAHV